MNIVVSHLLIPRRAILHVAPRIATEDRWLDFVRALQCPQAFYSKPPRAFRVVQCPTAVTEQF